MTATHATRALIRCDGAGASIPTSGWDVPEELWTDSSGAAAPDLNLNIESLAGYLIDTIDDRAADLVRIAAYAYGADQVVARYRPSDVHRRGWRREMTLCIPVTDPAFWSQPDIHVRLTEALGFGTEDTWHFAFDQAGPETRQLRLGVADHPLLRMPDTVLLFSGGIDSLCALVEEVADLGGRPVVVSHRSTPPVDSVQKALLEAVRDRIPDWAFPQLSFWIHRRGSDPKDTSQRTRGFLFAALGIAVAGQLGIGRVLLPDNGYVSLNPPISGQLVGALASRGTHPTFLRLMDRLAKHIFPTTSVKLSNPLESRTRAEALRVLTRRGVPELVGLTRSCGKHRGRPKERPHCGGCSQCVDRRIAVEAAGLSAHDPPSRYEIDLFSDALPEGEARTVALSYVEFARKVVTRSAEDLFTEYDELQNSLDPDDANVEARAEQVTSLLHRHGRETLWVLAEQFGRAREALASGTWPATSLLMLVGSTHGSRYIRAGTDRHVPDDRRGPQVGFQQAENEFRRHLDVWHVVFRGTKGTYPKGKGMMQLALLLEVPGQALDVIALSRLEAVQAERAPAAPVGYSAGIDPDLDEVFDLVGLRAFEARERELAESLISARALGNIEEVQQIQDELTVLRRTRQAARRRDGRIRRVGGAQEKARQAVSKNIRGCLERFALDHPPLHTHLERFLHLGILPRYDPQPMERWRVIR
jgi:hypothetical protein